MAKDIRLLRRQAGVGGQERRSAGGRSLAGLRPQPRPLTGQGGFASRAYAIAALAPVSRPSRENRLIARDSCPVSGGGSVRQPPRPAQARQDRRSLRVCLIIDAGSAGVSPATPERGERGADAGRREPRVFPEIPRRPADVCRTSPLAFPQDFRERIHVCRVATVDARGVRAGVHEKICLVLNSETRDCRADSDERASREGKPPDNQSARHAAERLGRDMSELDDRPPARVPILFAVGDKGDSGRRSPR